MSEQIAKSDKKQYPAALLDGDVLAKGYTAIAAALKNVMPDDGTYRYVPITSRPTETQWRTFTGKMPVVGIGWAGWHASKLDGRTFRGPLVYTVAVLTEHRQPELLYVGDGKLPGAFGVAAAAIGVLNGLVVNGVGTAFVTSVSSDDLAQFLNDGQASVLLTVQFDNASLDMGRMLGQLDTLKILHQNYIESKTGAEL
ncbi:hypothetical protein NKW53_13665 [Acetobacter orientalis]|uniref:hypothetical protein n=1 Tax=Acetobacter orientalis TaxID=146474 RepID=UPI00209F0EA6|nr:hypothetical protein [Acetobacter orientalis]MCP1217109.1 hypothetical protein [Acetobacter orientalis]MCP1220038.1 hypothetical protein [Acetobacter orientalis]